MAQIELLQPTEKIKDSYGKINTSVTNLNNAKLEKSGDTMTGNLRIRKTEPRLTLDTVSGSTAPLTYAEDSVNKWSILYDTNNDWLAFYSNVQGTTLVALLDDGTVRIKNGVIDTPGIYSGNGSPEGSVAAPVGSIYQRRDGASGARLYVKMSGSGNTGWQAMS